MSHDAAESGTSGPSPAPVPGPISAKSFGAMLLLALMWGLSIPVTKLGLITMPPLTLTAIRFAIAVPLMMFLVIGRSRLPWRALPAVAGLGILGIGIGQVTQTFGVAETSASVGTIISATIPMFIVFFAALRLKQPISRLQLIGVVAAFVGIILVASGSRGETGMSKTTSNGPLWLLVSAVAVAFYFVWSVELARQYGTIVTAAWSTLFGFIALLPWATWEAYHTPFQITGQALGAATYLGLVVTVAGLFLWLNILRDVPARIAASIQYLQPVFGIVASAMIFGDRIGPQFIVGVGLVLAGLALTMRTRGR